MVSLCQLRDQPQQFLSGTVRTSGWIYTDLERFDVEDGKCAVALGYEGRKDTGAASDMEQPRFEGLLKAAKKGTFNTNSELFAVVEGRFTSTSASASPGGELRAPNKLLITKMVCSVALSISQTDMASAVSSCFKHRASSQRPTP